MRALTVQPPKPDTAQVQDLPDPVPAADQLLVEGLAIGICGTDREIAAGAYGWAPPGQQHLILGHESLGRVRQAPTGSGFTAGDLVAGVVRRPDPEPCGACARGEFDMCRNGRYTEHGIKEVDGFGCQLWVTEPDRVVRLDPRLDELGVLVEPTSVVAKAWEQIDRVGARSWFAPRGVLITGAGPSGLLAALLGVQRGLDVHVLDRVATGPKPTTVAALGATYHHEPMADVTARLSPDIVLESTGAGPVIVEALAGTAPYGIVCLTGVSPAGHRIPIDAQLINRELVLENDVVIGSVNANLRHYRAAEQALVNADQGWLRRLITRRVPLERFAEAMSSQPDDIKVLLTLS